jgi:hypothetical protein
MKKIPARKNLAFVIFPEESFMVQENQYGRVVPENIRRRVIENCLDTWSCEKVKHAGVLDQVR